MLSIKSIFSFDFTVPEKYFLFSLVLVYIQTDCNKISRIQFSLIHSCIVKYLSDIFLLDPKSLKL